MASDKRGSNKKSSGDASQERLRDRAGLPFEPKGNRQRSDKSEREPERNSKPSKASSSEKKPKPDKSDKASKEKSAVSPQAQARVEEIRAMRQRRAEKTAQDKRKDKQRPKSGSADSAIPKDVSQRMLRRMAFFSGMPIALGVGVFFLSYYLQSREIVEFAPVAVLLVTMGCFGLGVLGLTYGVLSASWDEAPGGLIGLKEFKLNLGRALESWRDGKEAKS